jgi:N-acetylglucosamine-6-phosphate deacetylase
LKDPHGTTVLLRNARIVLPERTAEGASLLIQHARVARIIHSGESELPAADSVFDLGGLTLFPGFIDAHIHGAVGVDVMAASAADLHRVSEFLVTQGVTAWLPTLVPAPATQYARAVKAIAELMSSQESARVLGLHYEGPFVNEAQCGALHGEHFRTYSAPNDLEALPLPNIDGAVRMITIAPEIDGGVELVRELNERGWIVSIGHTRAAVDVLERAREAGARHMTHFMNAMAPLHHRAPGPIGWGLSRDDVTCDLIADGVHLDPFMLRLLLRLKTPDRLSLISDAIAATGLGDGEYQIWGETISVKDGRTRNSRGSIAGSVITTLDAVRMMLSLGVSEVDVARMASTNPARLLQIDQDYGSIEEGKRADLVALDASGQVRLTLVGGRVAQDSVISNQ